MHTRFHRAGIRKGHERPRCVSPRSRAAIMSSVSRWVNGGPSSNGIFVLKQNELLSPGETDGALNVYDYYVGGITPEMLTDCFQLEDVLEKARLGRQQKDQWLPGAEGGGREGGGGSAGGVEGSATALPETVMVAACHYTLVQTPRVSPLLSQELRVIMVWMSVPGL